MKKHSGLFLILSFLFASVAIFVGIELYNTYELNANKNAILKSINSLADDAYQFRTRPVSLGGGGGDYSNYRIPYEMVRTRDGLFTVDPGSDNLHITAISRPLNARIEADIDAHGKIVKCSFEGDFQ